MLVKARHILVDTQKQVAVVQQKLAEGADFAALAREFSLCPSKAQDGYLGEFNTEQMVKPFADAVVALTEGQISQPISTQFGYHIVQRLP